GDQQDGSTAMVRLPHFVGRLGPAQARKFHDGANDEHQLQLRLVMEDHLGARQRPYRFPGWIALSRADRPVRRKRRLVGSILAHGGTGSAEKRASARCGRAGQMWPGGALYRWGWAISPVHRRLSHGPRRSRSVPADWGGNADRAEKEHGPRVLPAGRVA